MNKARLTKSGAYRIGHPELEGEVIEFDKFAPGGYACIDNVFYKGKRLGRVLSYTGEDASVELLDD